MFQIENLTVSCDKKRILHGVNLRAQAGEIHAVMGRNGTGKSTLAKTIAGDPAYTVEEGRVLLDGENLLELRIDERAKKGLFTGFQYPVEIEGVSNREFLRAMINEKRKEEDLPPILEKDFSALVEKELKFMEMQEEFFDRGLNAGFSGGEKKKNEILQMALFDPKVAILDETDSGLDIDAMKIVAKGINHIMNPKKIIILITHYQRLLDYVKPDFVHIFDGGRIVKTGKAELAKELDEKGYRGI